MKRLLSVLIPCCCCLAAMLVAGVDANARGRDRGTDKVCLCHVPPGNPGNAHTICVGASAVGAHTRHGDSLGECPVTCGGSAGDTCGDDQFCKREDGACSEDAEGVCTDTPSSCPTTIDPVCGCDGNTYDNACVASAAGVNVANESACPGGACGGEAGDACGEGQFCKREEGACDENAEGVCTDIPAVCQPIQDPVCGCDNVTYSSACIADGAGVTVAHEGACEEGSACGGDAGDTCGDGEFCLSADGACDEAGTCTPTPAVCPSSFVPVCGCDGTTYSNSCFAHAAGVAVQHDGFCEEGAACGGSEGGTCEEGEFCRPAIGDCAEGAEGHCTSIPVVCPHTQNPVCGCDETTYANACAAASAGVGISHVGACEGDVQACGGESGGSCAEGAFCKHEGECAEDAAGVCTGIPAVCQAIVVPVCGCDGTTYSSACVAAGAGVNVDHDGPCQEAVACSPEAPCPEGEFCKGEEGACAEDAGGVCTALPSACPVTVIEVCGCDGTTYLNSCLAAAAGVTIDHAGACTVK